MGYIFNPRPDSQILGQTQNSNVFIPANGLKLISYSSDEIKIRDTEGVTYKFETLGLYTDDSNREYQLTTITSANNAETIEFYYDVFGPLSASKIEKPFLNTVISLTETHVLEPTIVGALIPDEVSGEISAISYHTQRPPRLREIIFRGGRVAFEYANSGSNRAWDLKNIKIYNNNQIAPLQTVELIKNVIPNMDNGREQQLNKVIFRDSQGHSYDYQFGYNEHIYMSKFNTGIDYWGYYNNAHQSLSKYIPNIVLTHDLLHPMDRTPDFMATQMGALNRITYPTKGYSTFTYEMNRAEVPQRVSGGLRIASVQNYMPDGALKEKKWYKYGSNESGFGHAQMEPSADDFTRRSRALLTEVTLPYYTPYLVMIKDIATFQSTSKRNLLIDGSTTVYSVITEYVGDAHGAYGKTIYRYNVKEDRVIPRQGNTYRFNSADMYDRTYQWARGQLIEKQTFRKENDIYKPVHSIQNNYQSINEAEYRNLRVLTFGKQITYPEYLASSGNFPVDQFCRYAKYFDYKAPYDFFNYYITTGLKALSSTIEIKDGVITTKEYQNNKYGQPILIHETNNSDGKQIATTLKYPADYPEKSMLSLMTSRNMISPVIEQITHCGTEFISSTTSEYTRSSSSNLDLIAPSWTKSTTGPNPLSDPQIVLYKKYDNYGNPQYITTPSNDDICYLWSYEALYPVLKIQNATYQQIETILGASVINTLSSQSNPSLGNIKVYAAAINMMLPQALVSYYTYKPLIGVTTMTDASGRTTNYDYDDFGRLHKVSDEDGNALETYEYHYRQ